MSPAPYWNGMEAKLPTNSATTAVVEYRTLNREVACSTHTRSTASNLEQVAKPTVCTGQLSFLPLAGREMSSSSAVVSYGVKA